MPPRPSPIALACLLAIFASAPAAHARPAGAGGGATLRIGVRILSDCGRMAASTDPACRPARQRSDGPAPVPAQVSALSPPAPPAAPGHAPLVTVTY